VFSWLIVESFGSYHKVTMRRWFVN